MLDVAIIGAGPIGLSCAIAASKRKLNYLVFEKSVVVNSIYSYPTNMRFFTTASEIEIGGIPLISQSDKPTRAEALKYYRRVAEHYDLQVYSPAHVQTIKKVGHHFEINLNSIGIIEAENIVLATGIYDNPNKLDISGD